MTLAISQYYKWKKRLNHLYVEKINSTMAEQSIQWYKCNDKLMVVICLYYHVWEKCEWITIEECACKQSLENVQSCNKTVLFFFNDWNTFRFRKISKINRVVSEMEKKKFPVFLKKFPDWSLESLKRIIYPKELFILKVIKIN